PPPPPPPPPPSPPPPPPPCHGCVSAKLQPPVNDVRPYTYDFNECFRIQQDIAYNLNVAIYRDGVRMTSFFSLDPSRCGDLEVSVCGTFFSAADAQGFQTSAEQLMPILLASAAGGSVCRPELEGYTVTVTTEVDSCLPLSGSVSCNLPITPFPGSTCNTTQGILPFIVDTRFKPGAKTAATTEYCFTIKTTSEDKIVPSSCAGANVLSKVAWYANQNRSSVIKAINLYPSSGTASTLSPSWGAAGTGSLQTGPLNWSLAQANGGRVCIELNNPATMYDICLGFPAQCFVRVLSGGADCCPTYRTGYSFT
ncbi:hypothetical protein Vretifemale_6203, partial [Volvox reticuliferus]